jgi:hypothetical protein
MTDTPSTDNTTFAAPDQVRKKRECLRCKSEFSSEWAGERICGRCKGSSAWKNGSPLRSGPSNGRGR